ncbi:MAG: heme exporter protein CcmB [Burkholderiaceae bacterium]
MSESALLQANAGSVAGVFASARWAFMRDLGLALRSRAELAVVFVFFMLVASLFPLAVAPEPALLERIAPGIAWVAALLSVLLATPHLFAGDHADGSLEQMLVSPAPLPALVAGKVSAHWLSTAFPVIVLAPLMGLQYGLDADAIGILVASLLLGTPVLAWFAAIGAALTLGARGGASLLALLLLPLAVPVLVFGAGAVETYQSGLSAQAHLSLLGAGLVLSWLGGPPATALAVRIAHE